MHINQPSRLPSLVLPFGFYQVMLTVVLHSAIDLFAIHLKRFSNLKTCELCQPTKY